MSRPYPSALTRTGEQYLRLVSTERGTGTLFSSRGHCKNVTVGLKCEFGMRRRSYHVLSGSVLSVWTEIESVFASVSQGRRQSKIQVVRLKTTDGSKIVGMIEIKGGLCDL